MTGILALAAALLTRQSPLAPGWLWLVSAALLCIPGDKKPLRWAQGLCGLLFGVSLVVFAWNDLHRAAFPQLSTGFEQSFDLITTDSRGVLSSEGYYQNSDKAEKLARKERNISVQVDASAVVQTGPGIPSWEGQRHSLGWDGPVGKGQQIQLFLLSPSQLCLLALLRSSLLVLVALRLLGRFKRLLKLVPLLLLFPLVTATTAYAQDPPAEPTLLEELETRLDPGICEGCLTVSSLELKADTQRITLVAEIHASKAAAWAIPGPAATWTPRSLQVDGDSNAAVMRGKDGFLRLRLEPGVHRIVLEGALIDDLLTLQLLVPPKRVLVDAPGFIVDGVRPDGSAEGSLQLSRTQSSGAVAAELAPRIEVHRFLDLGFPWRVRTEVRRVGEGDRPVSLKIPLLAGESVTDDGFVVKEGAVLASLGRDTTSVSWLSTLEKHAELVLAAPLESTWTEVWELSCSPIFACTTSGPPALQYVVDGAYAPSWRPWPGESLKISVLRP